MAAEPCQMGPIRYLAPCCDTPFEPVVPFCQPMRIQYMGEPTLCSVISKPMHEGLLSPGIKKKCRHYGTSRQVDKLGFPVGVLRSLAASSDKALFFDDKEMNGQRYAMCLKAYALLHILPIIEWNRSILDSLMIEGAELYAQQPTEHLLKSNEGGGDVSGIGVGSAIYSKEEAAIVRTFKLRGYEFEVELTEKLTPGNEGETGDNPPEINVTTLKPVLKQFFQSRNFCLLSTNNLYLLIWRSMSMHFVLDFYGRTQDKLESMREGGYATLLGLRGLDNVYYFISEMTTFGKRDAFNLREMRLTMMIDPEGRTQIRTFSARRAEQYVQVTPGYAYLKAELHLSLQEKDPLLARCGLPVAVAAIMASKIDHPGTWDERMLNKMICYGFFVCRCCWEFCQNSRTPIDLNSFPNQLQMGQFAVNITLIPQAYQGIWYCVPKIEPTELSAAIMDAFDRGYKNLILSINHQNYAIFRKNNFFYLFDAYRHRLPFLDTRSASLRMFNTLAEFLKVLNLILLESNTTAPFFLHRAVVTDIRVSLTGECHTALATQSCPEDMQDTDSINEAICFREDYKRCLQDLGQISEDEEEESFDEGDLEEYVEEVIKGEEEGMGELSGFEGSIGGRRRKGKRGRFGGRGPFGKRGFGRGGFGKGGKGGHGKGGYGKAGRGSASLGMGKGKGGKTKREKAGTSDSEKTDEDGKKKRLSRKSRASRSSRFSRSRASRSRASRSRESRSRGSRSRGSSSRRSRSSRSGGRKGGKRGDGDDDYDSIDGDGKGRGGRGGRGGRRDGSADSYEDGGRGGARGRGRDGEMYGKDGERYDKDGERYGKDGDRYGRDGEHRGRDGERYGRDGDRYGRDGERYSRDGDDFGRGGKGGRGGRGGGYGSDDSDGGRGGRGGRHGRGSDDGEGGRYGRRGDDSRGGPGGRGFYDDDGNWQGSGSGDSRGSDTYYDSEEREKRRQERELKSQGPTKANAYPGYSCIPYNLAVCGSESGTYESICKLLRAGFKCSDRILVMTPWGNFVVFRQCHMNKRSYMVYDGCTCNVERFRHLDLNCGTAGLIPFNNLHRTITYIIDTRKMRTCLHKSRQTVIDEICSRYCHPPKPCAPC